MRFTKYRLGNLVELSTENNVELKYGVKDVKGISIQKVFIETKANMDGVSLTPYKLVEPNTFAYVTVTSRNGEKITLAYNNSNNTYIVSSSYIVFKVKKTNLLSSEFLFMYFNRPEFDRYSRYNSWGSARETFLWEDMCDIELELPPIDIQKKYVDIYNAMVENQKSYEKGLEDLKLVCDAYLEDLRKKYPLEKIGSYIKQKNKRNTDNKIKNVKSVSISKEFKEPSIKVNRDKLENYKLVKPGEISFVQTTHNEKVFAYALNSTEEDIVVTSINEVIEVNKSKILPEYLSMWFSRKEFDRYARFHSWGSARETFTWEDVSEVKIPIPKISIQQSIVSIYKVYQERKEINEKLKQQIKDICPILIKGSIEEARK